MIINLLLPSCLRTRDILLKNSNFFYVFSPCVDIDASISVLSFLTHTSYIGYEKGTGTVFIRGCRRREGTETNGLCCLQLLFLVFVITILILTGVTFAAQDYNAKCKACQHLGMAYVARQVMSIAILNISIKLAL